MIAICEEEYIGMTEGGKTKLRDRVSVSSMYSINVLDNHSTRNQKLMSIQKTVVMVNLKSFTCSKYVQKYKYIKGGAMKRVFKKGSKL